MERKNPGRELDYAVVFPYGLRPHLVVYSNDEKKKSLYLARVWVCLSLDTGYHLKEHKKDFSVWSGTVTSAVLRRKDFSIDTSKDPYAEKNLLMNMRDQKVNCIKVTSKKRIPGAIEEHVRRYTSQFQNLEERCSKMFQAFIMENPSMGFRTEE